MPGALDVLVEIQFSANDSVLKEINSQLEKESNILKTIEERLNQLNAAASGQGAIATQLKLINREIEQTNRLLLRMQSSYKEVNYAAESLKNQNNVWATLAISIGKAPEAIDKLKAGVFSLTSALPQLGKEIDNVVANNQKLTNAGKPAVSIMQGLGKAFMSGGNLASLAAVGITFLIDKIFEESEAAKKATKDNKDYADSIKQIHDSSHRKTLEEKNDLSFYYFKAQDRNSGTTEQVKAAKKLQELYPGSFGNKSIEDIMTGKAEDAYKRTAAAVEKLNLAEAERQDQIEAQVKRDEYAPKLKQLDEELTLIDEKRKLADKSNNKNLYEELSRQRIKVSAEYDAIYKEHQKWEKRAKAHEQNRIDYSYDAEDLKSPQSKSGTEQAIASNTGNPSSGRKKDFLEEIRKINQGYTKEKVKLLAEDAVISRESIEKNIEEERQAAFTKLNEMVAAKREERVLTAAEEEEIAKTRVTINSKYYFELLKELDDYNKKKTELNKSISKLKVENDKKELLLKKDDLEAQLALIDLETNEQIRKTAERHDEVIALEKKLSTDTQDIEQEKEDALLTIQIEGQMKRLDAEMAFLEKQGKLIEKETSKLLADAEIKAQAGIIKTKNPRKQAVLTTQSNITTNLIKQDGVMSQLIIAQKELSAVKAAKEAGTASAAQLKEAQDNVDELIGKLASLQITYANLAELLKKQKLARVIGVFEDVDAEMPTPTWATWVFRVVFLLTTATTIIISSEPDIADELKVKWSVYLKAIDFVIWGIARGIGVSKEQFTNDNKEVSDG